MTETRWHIISVKNYDLAVKTRYITHSSVSTMKFKQKITLPFIHFIPLLIKIQTIHNVHAEYNPCAILSKASLSTIVNQAARISVANFKIYHKPDQITKLGNITFTELENLKSDGDDLPNGILKTGPFTSVKNLNPGCPFKPNPKLKYLLFLGTQSWKI